MLPTLTIVIFVHKNYLLHHILHRPLKTSPPKVMFMVIIHKSHNSLLLMSCSCPFEHCHSQSVVIFTHNNCLVKHILQLLKMCQTPKSCPFHSSSTPKVITVVFVMSCNCLSTLSFSKVLSFSLIMIVWCHLAAFQNMSNPEILSSSFFLNS